MTQNCDIDGIMCEIQVTAHLKGLKTAMGDKFEAEFPELASLADKIKTHEVSLRTQLEGCGFLHPEEIIQEAANESGFEAPAV